VSQDDHPGTPEGYQGAFTAPASQAAVSDLRRAAAGMSNPEHIRRSVMPEWMMDLPLQQQSVLMLAARGPDGIAKSHPCKDVQRAYRATVLMAGRYGRMLELDEDGDTFMSLASLRSRVIWEMVVRHFFHEVDSLPHHFVMHLLHGAQILGYKHPDEKLRRPWRWFYLLGVEDMHMTHESEDVMDRRLSDWDRKDWA
jgi:hypothetical protein